MSGRPLGALGEAVALAFLLRRGATVIARNVRVGRGEIDLLMRIDGIVVAAEVKTRYGADPLLQMTEEKERRMLDAAGRVRPRPARIDVLSVEFGTSGATVRWIRGLS